MGKRYRLIKVSMIATAVILAFSGCNKKNQSQGENQDILTGTPAIEQERVEPSLTKDAKKLKQFAELKKGDQIAEIVVADYGTMKIKLFSKQAPKAVENFVKHSKEGYYDGVTFHRILEDFMIQGGDPEGTGMGGESIWGGSFEDEFTDDLYPYRGALCMANSGADTNKSQFFVVQADENEVKRLQDLVMERYKLSLIDYIKQGYATDISEKELNHFLSYGGAPWLTRHHTVFGQLYEGFDVLDAIAGVELADESGVPKNPVVIEKINILEYQGE